MKFALFALLAACACFAVALAGKPGIYEREGHLHDLRERLGHFKEQPYIDLYKQYAAAFVLPLHKNERPKDDYRNYRPSGRECLSFLRSLRVAQYAVKDFNDLIRLDACLGYLFDDTTQEHETDPELSAEDRGHVATLKEDTTLSELYSQTKVNELAPEAQGCVADLLLSNVLARYQYKEQNCNNHFLQLYLQFAECQDGLITAEQRTTDSYLMIIYAILKERVHECFDNEIGFINMAIRKAYAKDKILRTSLALKTMLLRKKSSLQSIQQKERMWPTPVVELLSAVQKTKNEVNVRQVHQLIRGVYLGDQTLTDRFLNNIAHFADMEINPNKVNKATEEAFQNLYTELIDRTCQFFRSSDSESEYDFATPLIRMVELLNHEDLFDLTAKKFVDDLVVKTHAPVYLAVSACNLLSFTEATILNLSHPSSRSYKVAFFPDTSKMAKWPVANYY